MRAAVFDSSFDIKLKDVTSAAPGPGEVEVRAKAAGLCAGDLYIYLGKNPYVTFPRVGGHEIAGVVSAVGPGVAEFARARGAEVFITDIQRERLATARELGAQPLPAGDVAARSLQLTNGEGMPVVIEATGTASVMEQTVDLVAAGGRIVIVGLVKSGTAVGLPGLDITRKEMTLHGSRASVDCFPEALRLIGSGAIRYPRIATRVELAEAPDIFARLAESADAYHKAVFVTEAA